ncbi:MAG: endonuclease domain-containing protein [Cellulomonas sp.]|nr:endonuclease domain-containing protein [Cellulomonas sp.]
MTTGVFDAGPALVGRMGSGPDHLRRRAAWVGLAAHGQHAVAVGPCAVALHGIEGLPPSIRPEVALATGQHRRVRDQVVVRCYDPRMPVVRLGEAAVAAPAWAVAQTVCELDVRRAVATLDSAVHLGVLDGVGDVRRICIGRRGSSRLAQWWDAVDGRAESPLESVARVVCRQAGLAPDDLQVPMVDAAGRVLARGDLGWRLTRGRWLFVELDGAQVHDLPRALYRDRARQNDLVATGRVELLRFTAADIWRGTEMVAAITTVLRRHGR